jgi:preprotein translocase subunit YajC
MTTNQGFITLAQTTETPAMTPAAPAAATSAAPMAPPPSSTEMLLWNAGFIVLMIVMFYLLQQRYKEHNKMLGQLKKGDRVVLQSGLIGVIDSLDKDGQEMVLEFEGGVKAKAFKSAIAGAYDSYMKK